MGHRQATWSARDHALAVLRVRNTALALVLLPLACAVVLLAGAVTGRLPGAAGTAGLILLIPAVLALAGAGAVATVIARARPPAGPGVEVPEHAAPGLHALIRDLADRLDVPAPGGVALAPDCDSWLEERPARPRSASVPPVLVVGSPFLWWMRVGELRALLAPVVAGTGPSAHPDIAAARRCVRGLDATVARAARAGRRGPLLALSAAVARALLRSTGGHAAEMERGVAAAAASRARTVDYGVRVTAQEQVGLAYAGWDRLLTKVALPAWQTGRWPRRLNAGVAAALTELSRRDRLAGDFTSRLGERPACDLLEEPGRVDEEVSLLAAELFHGIPAEPDAPWEPVDWAAYPEEVVDRIWRERAARLFTALDAARTPTLTCLLQRLGDAAGDAGRTDALAARVGAGAARAAGTPVPAETGAGTGPFPPALPAPPPRTGREVLAEHVAAAVCCAAADSTDAAPGLDWLDGPVLRSGGRRVRDLTEPVRGLVDDGDPEPLREWLAEAGIRPDKPVRLV
ncbi:hypothetical protein GCM10009716_36330 [Streptomyces sodiiphilus]|uniref:Integral membrane protein n=1 Tax=Streptomyces sodiiphilus TaxID=226217 RepID=A0ABP5AXB0_9ACTN